MSRYVCTIKPTHFDDTLCTHKHTSSGKPLERCPGRVGVTATCSCGEELGSYIIPDILKERRAIHLGMHATRDAQSERGR